MSINNFADLEANQVTLHGDIVDISHAVTKEYVDFQISSIVSGAPSYLDTLKEIHDFLGASDGQDAYDVVTKITEATSQRSDISDALVQEIKDRVSDVKSVSDSLSTEIYNRLSSVTSLKSYVDSEFKESLQSEISEISEVIEEVNVSLISSIDILESSLDASITQSVSTLSSAVQVNLDKKLDNGDHTDGFTKYRKREDGNFQIAEPNYEENKMAYFYVGDDWRIKASNTSDEKRLVFEYKNGENWHVGIPFFNTVSTPPP